MPFSLPVGFKNEVNELAKLIRDYEAAVDDITAASILRTALTTSCRMLNAINLRELRVRLDEVRRDANRTAPNWQSAIIGDEGHFSYFLDNVEAGILKAIDINSEARQRILHEVRVCRALAAAETPSSLWSMVIPSIDNLRRDVCMLRDHELNNARRRLAHYKLVKNLCTIVIIVNAVGSVYFPPATPAALAASITLGGVSLRIPEPK
jgi:hypothetical protein